MYPKTRLGGKGVRLSHKRIMVRKICVTGNKGTFIKVQTRVVERVGGYVPARGPEKGT